MALQDEINEKKKEISTDGYPMSIGELISLYKEKELDIHPEFQRFFRWSVQQKSKLIESILLGIPIPSIFVSQRPDGVWDVVDGLQRLSTIFEFVGILKNEQNEEVKPSKLVKTSYLPALEGKYWEKEDDEENSFDSTQRLIFKREKIDVKIVKKESDDTIKFELFQRLNTLGSKLSDQEVRNCLLIMLNKDFYTWLKTLSDDEDFLNTMSLTDKLIDEKYNMELALRFLILNEINPNEVRGVTDFSEFVTDKMILIANDDKEGKYNRDKNEVIFRETFHLLNTFLSESPFKKFVIEKGKFEGKFLLAAFEAVAIGIGKNITLWNTHLVDDSADKVKENLTQKIKNLWSNPLFLAKYGSGVNVTSRVPFIVPLGTDILKP